MIRIVIVEDKQPILRTIRNKIEQFGPEVVVVGEASDGLMGLEMVRTQCPDILITDIQMPGIDGLELISNVKEKFKDIQCVIISGYDDFEYARRAIKLGVTEYLLKPITQKNIDALLGELTKKINGLRSIEEKQKIQMALINRKMESEELDYTGYIIFFVCYGPYLNYPQDFYSSIEYLWNNKNIYGIASKEIPENHSVWVMDGENINEEVLVLAYKGKWSLDRIAFAKFLQKEMSSNTYPITIAVSNEIKSINQLRQEYQITRFIMKKYIPSEGGGIINNESFMHTTFSTEKQLIPEIELQRLIMFLINRNKKEFSQELQKLLSRWKREKITQEVLENRLEQITIACMKSLIEYDINKDAFYQEVAESITKSYNYEDLYKELMLVFEHLIGYQEVEGSATYIEGAIVQVINFFEDNLSRVITLTDIAQLVNLNPSYLSREFKKLKKVSPMEYLNDMRIKKAQQMMLSGRYKFKEIAELVGYSNQYYFSRVFKLATGVSPSEYKQQQQEG